MVAIIWELYFWRELYLLHHVCNYLPNVCNCFHYVCNCAAANCFKEHCVTLLLWPYMEFILWIRVTIIMLKEMAKNYTLPALCLQLCCGELFQRTLRHSAPAAAAKVCLLGSGALNKNPCCQNFRIWSYFEYSRYLWHFPTLAPSGGKSAGGLMRWSGQVRCSIRTHQIAQQLFNLFASSDA